MLLLDPAARPVIAHRGERAHSPENTLVAFERGLAAGAEAIELDVHVTADGHVVVCHDATVDRTTDGTGSIDAMPLAAIRELDAGARWSPHADPERANGGARGGETPFRGRSIRVPLLTEVLEAFPATPLMVEVKSERAGNAIVPLLHRFNVRERLVIGSYLHAALQPARAAGYRTAASQSELQRMLSRALLRWRRFTSPFDIVAMPPHYLGIPLPITRFVLVAPVPVHIWTVNDPRQARAHWACGARGILTDDPAVIVAERRAIAA